MKVGIVVDNNIQDQLGVIQRFSANAIKAGAGNHTYEIVFNSQGDFDYILKFKKIVLVYNANNFKKLLEQQIKGCKVENNEFILVPKTTVSSPLTFDTSINDTYIVAEDSNLETFIKKHIPVDTSVWAYNSESLVKLSDNFDTVICVGSGLIPLGIANQLTASAKIYIVDINQNCLDFQQQLIANLDSFNSFDDYQQFVSSFTANNSINAVGAPNDKFINLFENILQNKDLIQSHSFYYVNCDLRMPVDKIRTVLKDSIKPLVVFSNIFSYVPTLLEGNQEQDFVLFLNILLGSNLNVTWYGDTYDRTASTNMYVQGQDQYCWKKEINLPHQEFFNEIRILEKENLFVKHRTRDGHRGTYFNHGWSSFCLHGIGYDMTQGPEHYGYTEETAPYKWTNEAVQHCPIMIDWFEKMKFKDRYHRVRIMKLSPGGIVGLHNDNSNSKASATNMAVNNPVGCEMHFFDRQYRYLGVVPWRAGDVYKIQIGLNHYVINKSNQDRYHLIIHGTGGFL